MRKANQTILAIDPGLRELGFAIMCQDILLDSGVLPLRHLRPQSRLWRVREAIRRWVSAYDPGTLVIEHIPRRPLDAVAGLPALGRLLRRLAKAVGLELATYSARTARRTVVGDGWAGKAKVADRLTGRFPELRVYRGQNRKWKDRYWQNMFDAIALALHHDEQNNPPSRSRRSG